MGTNYYLYQKPDCECCKRPFDALHIGKSSGGWCFALHVMPEGGINMLDDWRKLWSAPGAFIRDEFGDAVSVADMENLITVRSGDGNWANREFRGYNDESDFHQRNYSQCGPKGLMRHRVGPYCIGHGEGTWDYMVGEFC